MVNNLIQLLNNFLLFRYECKLNFFHQKNNKLQLFTLKKSLIINLLKINKKLAKI